MSILFLALGPSLPLSAAAQAQVVSGATTTSATRAGLPRTVEPFEALVVRGPVDVLLRQAAQPGLWVRATAADAARVEARVLQRDGRATLEISFDPPRGWVPSAAPSIAVDWVRLTSLTLQGSGQVRAEGMATASLQLQVQGAGGLWMQRIDTGSLSIALAGSGGVRADGRAAALAIQVAGSGNVDAAGLDADVVQVSIAGSGDVAVRANQTLSARVDGSGDLRYSGAAQVQTRVAGSGSVTRR